MESDLFEQLQATIGERYRIVREIGGGEMSRVFLAEDVALQREVVIRASPPAG